MYISSGVTETSIESKTVKKRKKPRPLLALVSNGVRRGVSKCFFQK
jgi:hypothetical protein